MLEWNVYIENFNGREIVTYNVFSHPMFSGIKKQLKKNKDITFEEFEKIVKKELTYHFWSKCEWEIILSAWPPSDIFIDKKVSVYDQIMLNWNRFISYAWENKNKL